MKCTICSNTALRIGTKGRAYCKAHEDQAWTQMRDDAEKNDIRHMHNRSQTQREWRQEKLSRAI